MIKPVNVEVNIGVEVFGVNCVELVITDAGTGKEVAALAVKAENLLAAAIVGNSAQAPGLLKSTDKPRPKYTDVRMVKVYLEHGLPKRLLQGLAIEQVRTYWPEYSLITKLASKHTYHRTINGLTHYVVKIGIKAP